MAKYEVHHSKKLSQVCDPPKSQVEVVEADLYQYTDDGNFVEFTVLTQMCPVFSIASSLVDFIRKV